MASPRPHPNASQRREKRREEERRREEKRGKERRRRRTKESSRQDRRGPSHRGRHSPPCHNASGNTAHAAHAADAADAAALFREAAPRLQIRPLCAGLGSLSQRSTLQLSQSSQKCEGARPNRAWPEEEVTPLTQGSRSPVRFCPPTEAEKGDVACGQSLLKLAGSLVQEAQEAIPPQTEEPAPLALVLRQTLRNHSSRFRIADPIKQTQ